MLAINSATCTHSARRCCNNRIDVECGRGGKHVPVGRTNSPKSLCNSVACLPCQVEPCFRVSDNRDEVLLGLVHALGGRLLCSSQLDIRATLRGVPRGSPILSPPPRLLDQHVCRSPSMLRAGATAQVGLYEVRSVHAMDGHRHQ